jgi:hypothetical protein
MENEQIETQKKQKKPRALKYPDGFNVKNYNKQYYKLHAIFLPCEFCNSQILQHGMMTHQKTKRCMKLRDVNNKPVVQND